MIDGVRLSLLIGPYVPVPAPRVVMDALQSIEITTAAGRHSGFQLSFSLERQSPLHTLFLLSGGDMAPWMRVVITAIINGLPEVLMDGVLVHHEVTAGDNTGNAVLTVTGEDLTRVMDDTDHSGTAFPNMPPSARVMAILAKYAAFGIVPMVIPASDEEVPNSTERIFQQQGSDLEYLTALARDASRVFCLIPGPAPLTSIAYWGPEIKVGVPQPALTTNMDMYTNVESISFAFDANGPLSPRTYVQVPLTKMTLPVPYPAVSWQHPPLGLFAPLAHREQPLKTTAKKTLAAAQQEAFAMLTRSQEAVTASGTLDVTRYGHVLRARQLVGVRGAGTAFDGLYYVRSVKHQLKRGEFKQSFELSRNGLVSTLPRVPA